MPTRKRRVARPRRSPSRKGVVRAPARRPVAKRAVKRNGKRPALDTFTRAYLEAALWSSTDDDGTPLNRNYSISDIPAKELAKAVRDCKKFQRENERWIDGDSSQAGHDFWLTRNYHGSGFRDGHWPEVAERHLTDAAHAFGEVNPYVHRGRVYF